MTIKPNNLILDCNEQRSKKKFSNFSYNQLVKQNTLQR